MTEEQVGLLRLAGKYICEGRIVMAWGSLLAYRDLCPQRKDAPSVLDESFCDHAPFAGNEMKRVANRMEQLGLQSTFRGLLAMDEPTCQRLLSHAQIGKGAMSHVAEIRSEYSYWYRLYHDV